MADKVEPYVGPRPFTKNESELFFGRDQEADELVSLITAHPVVLFYAQSGAGKSSLLNAQVIPKLEAEDEGFEVIGPLRVQGQIPSDFALDKMTNIYVLNALLSYHADKDSQQLSGITLRQFLNGREPRLNKFKEPSPRVIIFDQFEELFTSYPDRWEDRAKFFEQVRDAIEGSGERGDAASNVPLRVVFSMREDYIAELDPYAPILQEKLRTRYRLERLRETASLSAIARPLEGTGRSYAAGVAEQIVLNLRKIPGRSANDEPKLGPYIEPVQLQVVCQSIWQALGPDEKVITKKHLTDYGDVNRALSAFYENSIRAVSEKTGVAESALRSWFGKTLITSDGMRAPVYRGMERTEGMPNAAVDMLDSMQLLKSELKGAARWYELAHDRFVEPVRKSNEKWLAEQSIAEQARLRLEGKAERWRQGHGELLNATELAEARSLLKRRTSSNEDLRALVGASQASSQRKRVKLLTRSALGLLLLLLLTTGVGGYALYQNNAAGAALLAAEANRAVAEAKIVEASRARAEADQQRAEALSESIKAREAEGKANEQVGLTEKALEDVKAQKKETEKQAQATKDALIVTNRERDRANTEQLKAKAANRDLQKQLAIIKKQQELLNPDTIGEVDPEKIRAKNPEAFVKIGSEAAYTTEFLNHLFGDNLNTPKITPLDENERNTYWDGHIVHAPATAQYLPDLIYHETSHLFIEKTLGAVPYRGESGSIQEAYGDIYAMLVKQKKLNQNAQEADWLVGPGAIAWINGEDVVKSQDRRALHSLKNPGTAYDDPVIGKDRQVAHMKDFVKTESDNGGVHANSGIPSKAFYETAMRLGSKRAGVIWTQALKDPSLPRNMTFKYLAQLTYKVAASSEEKQAIKQAWEIVGIKVE